MSSHLCYKLPNLGTAFNILETQRIILAIWFCPDDERVGLPLVDVVGSDGDLQENLLGLFRLCNQLSLSNLFIVFAGAECRAEVFPVLTDELIDLYENEEWVFISLVEQRVRHDVSHVM